MKLLLLFLMSFSTLYAASNVDPMRPPAYAQIKIKQNKFKAVKVKKTQVTKTVKKALKLQSILISKQRKIAIINEKPLGLGDKINGAKLIKISKNKVRLIKKGKVIDLMVNSNQSDIKITRSKQVK